MGEEGFSSDSSLLYHAGVPSAIVDSQVWELPDLATSPNHPLKPRHLKLHDLPAGGARRHRSAAGAGQRGRADQLCRQRRAASPYYRNAVGDECVYVEAGAAPSRPSSACCPTGPATTW